MTIPTILTDVVEASIQANEVRIRGLAETIKESLMGGTRYVAFPVTHITALPDGELPVPADNLAASYPNETLSLADFEPIIDPSTDFTLAAATGFQYKSPWGIGYFIEYEVQVGDDIWVRSVNYGVPQADQMFEHDWRIKVDETELSGV